MMTSSNGNIFRVTCPLCGEFTGPGEFPAQRPVTRSFDVFFDLRPNKRLSKQPWGWWFETPSWSLWRQCNASSHSLRQRLLWPSGQQRHGHHKAVNIENLLERATRQLPKWVLLYSPGGHLLRIIKGVELQMMLWRNLTDYQQGTQNIRDGMKTRKQMNTYWDNVMKTCLDFYAFLRARVFSKWHVSTHKNLQHLFVAQ